MELTYDGIALHNLGEIEVAQRREFEGGENPYRIRVEMTVTLRFWERTFADNFALVRRVRDALNVQHGQLRWTDAESGSVWVEAPATVSAFDWPEDPNSWGTYQQMARVVFQFVESTVTNNSAAATLTFPGGATIALPQLISWREQIATERFDALRSGRRTVMIRLSAAGLALADSALPVATRRSTLEAQRNDWRTKVTSAKEATLAFGGFSAVVRIDSFDVEVDQAGHSMPWSFSAYYTAKPDEAKYSIAEYSLQERNPTGMVACGTGEQFYSLSGRVQAHSDADARTRINEIRLAILDPTLQVTETEGESRTVDGMDGAEFIERTFRLSARGWRPDNAEVVFEKTGSGAPVLLGNVAGFTQRYSAQRFNNQRSQRQAASGQVVIRGTLFTGTQDPGGVTQREQLIAMHQGLLDRVNGSDGTLSYGTVFSKVVRVEEFTAEINQAINGIEWTLTASYSEFPNETNYATVEYTAQTRESSEDGDLSLSFSGRIQATSQAAANAKLDTLRTTVLAQYGFSLKQRLATQNSDSRVYANGDKTSGLVEGEDGTTFLELTFSEDYRRRAANVLTYTLRISDSDEVRAGFITTAYSGTVTASGGTAAAAYAAALAQANALGADKYPFITRSSISYDQRKATTEGDVEFVRLEFTFEYQRKGSRVYVELASSVALQAFENDRETVSGYASAADEASARAAYALVRALYSGRLVLAEESSVATQKVGDTSQFARLDFRLEVFKPKAANATTFRYEIDTAKEWTTLSQTISVQGTAFGSDRAAVLAAVEGFTSTLGLSLDGRKPTRTQRTESFGKEASGTTLFQVAFSDVYVTELTGVAGILECSVTEEVQYSGTRWVVQDVPRNAVGTGGVSIVQDCGVDAGRRTVRGSAVAATLGTAKEWASAQKSLLTGDADAKSYPVPEQLTVDYEFSPLLAGVVSGIGANVKMVRVAFTYGEILPNYPYA
jgi:hypothetical protein